jgi:YggT family protein
VGFAIVYYILLIFLVCLWTRVLLSYFPLSAGSPANTVARAVGAVTDPVLIPVRKLLPMVRIGGAGLDLSPIVVSFIVIILMGLL